MKPSERITQERESFSRNHPDACLDRGLEQTAFSVMDELDLLDARLSALESKPAVPATEEVAREIVEAILKYNFASADPKDCAEEIAEQIPIVSAILARHATTKA